MESLFEHLGIDWKLLLAQGANFFLLAILLNYFLYKPLVKLINDRRKKIEAGLVDAKEAHERLEQAEVLRQAEVLKGERQALAMIEEAKKEGETVRKEIMENAEKDAEIMKEKTEEMRRRLIQREMDNLEKNAKNLIESAITAAVGLNPDEIDKKLIDEAVSALKSLKS